MMPLAGIAQPLPYFQQKVDVRLDVSLDAAQKTLDGFAVIQYTNNAPDTLHYIWFHLWPNAYKNDRTAFSEQMLKIGRTDFYFSDEALKGYINKLNFAVGGRSAALENHPYFIDVARLILPEALPPGKSVTIETPFHVKLPYLFSRSGFADDFFLAAQWFPKPAVYDRDGWHPMPYLDQGEFYSEFGDYEVSITVPRSFDVAATGKRISEEVSGQTKTLVFAEQNLHDFAWMAGKKMIVDSTEIESISGKKIGLYSWYTEDDRNLWQHSLRYISETIAYREQHIGAYPYATMTVVATPPPFTGGMEYPGFTTIQSTPDSTSLIELIDHEVGHNWFQAALATNERDFAWMDEGMNSFYTKEFMRDKRKRSQPAPSGFFRKRLPEDYDETVYNLLLAEKLNQPANLSSAEFDEENYYAINYFAASEWMAQLKDFLGHDLFSKAMRAYYQRWQFKHPRPEDFRQVLDEISGKNTDSLFSLLYSRKDVRPTPQKEFRVASFFSLRDTDRYRYVFMAPALGINKYDGLMAGLLIHNYTLPKPDLHFLLAPMWGTASGKLTGMGRIGYSFKSFGRIRKIEPAIAAASFSMRRFVDSTGRKNHMGFTKVVPSVRLTFRNRDPLSASEKFLQWKTYLISETGIRFQRDTIRDIDLISYPKSSRYLNELSFTNRNDRILYPYTYTAAAQQGDGFVRITGEASQFFNYQHGGGLNVRVFAGKLFYTDNSMPRYLYKRYQFNMTGANGYEDYTYSNYFIGRNEFEGAISQQIMIRDGGFKVRTDYLNNKTGTSDDWLAALNLNTDLPRQINPLSILPFDIKLKAFLDIGTYAAAWEKGSEESKFLFDAGLQLNLLHDVAKVYLPLLYSKTYGDYFKSTIPKKERFWRTISFSIDIQNFRLKNLINLPH